MTNKQKEAIITLNRIKESNTISDEEYFTLMEFVVEDKSTQKQYIPYYETKGNEVYPKISYQGYEGTVTGPIMSKPI